MTLLVEKNEATFSSGAELWLGEYGDYLYNYAVLRVSRHDVAEDLVHDTLLAALVAETRFQHRSSVRTWLTGILKNRLLDHIRRSSRGHIFEELTPEVEILNKNFDRAGCGTRH